MSGIPFPNIDPIAFQIGPLAIRWYALAYIVGILLGWWYCMRLAKRSDMRPNAKDFDDFVVWAVLGIILGGRFGYVVFYNAAYYAQNPIDALKVWEGGMSFHGGLIGVIVAIFVFSWRRGFAALALADLVAAATPIGLFFGRIANFVNGELYGRTTDASWGIVFPHGGDLPRHPSQLYEAFLEGLVLFVLLAVLAHRRGVREHVGLLTGAFLVGYGIARTFVELFREPDPQLGFIFGPITMGQILSAPMILLGLYLMLRAWFQARRVHTEKKTATAAER
ncbi:prolipoprotein diacylglyceryl transferase (plasmid) [Nitratireductor rhodophyticola]|uniref:prolipoprotein diacylglyceryl transferase n=1 Tax=Nitratireductor rhodophyticola TaxID=2854036 RepID=UPI000C8CC2EF|nr:prolipoprotein diacylglyceryl transferase [Nitratireductor rhodophyticola]MAS15456.1 prolipoprotein diacylglyceryl transferase [Nitratireductor sp.]WPZ16433.1 prolipoprotein diacylglyceryl transferase [Nitratireductor rhodophyticola]